MYRFCFLVDLISSRGGLNPISKSVHIVPFCLEISRFGAFKDYVINTEFLCDMC